MGESKRELAIKILKENACMFNSCLAKDELKRFKNYDFVQYLINCLSIPEHNYDNCHNATCKRKSRKDGYEQAVNDIEEMIEDTDWYHIHNGNLIHGANTNEHEPLYKHSDIKNVFERIRGGDYY